MHRASAVFLSLLVLTACSGGNGSSASTDKAKQFPVPDEAKGTKYEMGCRKAKPLAKDRDQGISLIEDFLAEPDLSEATRAYYEKKLRGFYVDRALIIAANPDCFTVALLEEAHRITDARNKSA
jgi:hypothetical protein